MAEKKPYRRPERLSHTADALRKMNEELGDSEFEIAIAPYNNYTGGTPADRHKYEGMYKGAGDMTLKGQYMPPDATDKEVRDATKEYWNPISRREEQLSPIPDMVQTITSGANPSIQQHEYNHRNNPERSERENRFVDALIAPDKRAWESAVDFQVDLRRRRGSEASREKIEEQLLRQLQEQHNQYIGPRFSAKKVYQEEMDRGGHVPESMKENKWSWIDEYDETDKMQDYGDMRKKQTYWSTALRKMIEKQDK